MTVAGVATSHTKKLVRLTLAVFRPRFNSSKCKTAAKMAVARIKLLRNKREVVVRQMRRDIALLLQTGQDATARIRVEHVIREQNVLAANEFIELFCELIVARLTIIRKQRDCPADLKEGIASLIFAAPRCSEIPELVAIRDIFEKKYGRDFMAAATDLRPSCGVNRLLIDKLSVRTPSGEMKLKVMKEIAKEHQIDWDTTETEKELLKPPQEHIEGPRTFVSASSLPVNPPPTKPIEANKPMNISTNGQMNNMHFQDTASAAEAAAESAKQAIAAANAAAHLAKKGFNQADQPNSVHNLNASGIHHSFGTMSGGSTGLQMPYNAQFNSQVAHHLFNPQGRMKMLQHPNSHYHVRNGDTRLGKMDGGHVYRRHSYNEAGPGQIDDEQYRRHSYNDSSRQAAQKDSYNASSPHSNIKFDESDCDEELEMEEGPFVSVHPPPERPPPPAPSSNVTQNSVHRVHPKLPDYDILAARFEALKYQKSQN